MNWQRLLRMIFLVVLIVFSRSFDENIRPAFSQDRQTYCDQSDRTVLIFIDRTTTFDEVDKKLFVEGFERIMARIRTGDLVVVHTIADSHTASNAVFNRCVPGCPNEGLFNWLVGTCKTVVARGDFSRFRTDLANGIRTLLDHPQSFDRSDIVRTIAAVSRTHEARTTNADQGKVGLVFVFSDLLENSDIIPWRVLQYGSFEQALAIVKKHQLQPAVRDAEVAAFGFGRSHDLGRSALTARQDRDLRGFWQGYFELGGAASVYIGQYLD